MKTDRFRGGSDLNLHVSSNTKASSFIVASAVSCRTYVFPVKVFLGDGKLKKIISSKDLIAESYAKECARHNGFGVKHVKQGL